jgi:hypothetical protein
VPARAVTPGQAAVFYDGDRVLGGATIVGPWQPDVVADLGGVPA